MNAVIKPAPAAAIAPRFPALPLGGRIMAGLMYDAITSMGAGQNAQASLLPSSQSLDLFVTTTDYQGHAELLQIHDPPLIEELEHRHILHFAYRRRPDGKVDSDFELDNAAGLAFAARATSSWLSAFFNAVIASDRALRLALRA